MSNIELLGIVKPRISYNKETGIFTRNGTGAEAGGIDAHGYRVIRIGRKIYKAHRLAFLLETGEFPLHDVDHIDGVRGNNKWSNLRSVTRQTNTENHRSAHAHSKTGLIGVCFNKHKQKFVAQIKTMGRVIYLGQFGTAAEGHAAYINAKRNLHQGNTL